VKFTERGRVSLRVELQEAADNLLLHFEVADTGIGVAAENQALIFEPFSQVDGSHTRRYGGPGLGLTICARFVALMHGRIWVESEPGHGSRFHFVAPFERASQQAEPPIGESVHASALVALATAVEVEPDAVAAPAAVPPAENPAQAPGSLCILLAEDNPVNQKLACRLLNKRGHAVVVAGNGIEALAALDRQRFDLVLMDIQMPGWGDSRPPPRSAHGNSRAAAGFQSSPLPLTPWRAIASAAWNSAWMTTSPSPSSLPCYSPLLNGSGSAPARSQPMAKAMCPAPADYPRWRPSRLPRVASGAETQRQWGIKIPDCVLADPCQIHPRNQQD
jgi:hypothetical protein